MGFNQNMKQASPERCSAFITKRQHQQKSSIFPANSAAEQRQNDAAIRYFKSIQSKVNPHLEQFEALSKQVPLK